MIPSSAASSLGEKIILSFATRSGQADKRELE